MRAIPATIGSRELNGRPEMQVRATMMRRFLKPTRRCCATHLCIVVGALLMLMPAARLHADSPDHYQAKIKPLLRQRCYTCHGALKQQAGLRLDTVAWMIQGGNSGPVVRPGNAADSPLLARVSATDPAERMPPEEEGEPLTPEQIALLRDWIVAGAAAPTDERPEADPRDHWSFQPVVRPEVPLFDGSGSMRNPIDAFLARQHRAHGLVPQIEAPRVVLVRRLYLDLIGLPPSAEELAALERDSATDWYERTVERLLDDPRHGERWARHWMDVWRYSDWWGLGDQLRNSQKHIWHWRDWIVESLNDDVPYDEMIRLMLAADELHPNDLDKLRATGFLARNWFLFNRHSWMEETVEHVGKGFLGLTLNCAKCHDHKFDPIEQADFFRMRAFFEPYHVRMDLVPGESDLSSDGIPRVYDGLPDVPTYLFVRGDEKNPDESKIIAPGVPKLLAFQKLTIEPVNLPAEAWQPARRPWVLEAYLVAARKKVEAAQAEWQQSQSKPRDATAELALSGARLALARAELESVERRAEAMRTEWSDAADDLRQERKRAAIRAEQRVALAGAELALKEAALQETRAADDKKEAAVTEVNKARETAEKLRQAGEAPIAEGATFTPLTGAAWTPTRFLSSGSDDPTVEFLPQSTGRRTALARWITDPRNPLTARVAVNHIWTRHMGQPLVPTTFDFGRNGARPADPQLIDWLASELMDSGWSMKHLHRLIVTSEAYRRSSSTAGREDSAARDPGNRYWWRRVPIRLESQVVRDSLLALAGTLDPTIGGPPVPREQQDTSGRRSLYFFHSNNERNLFLTTFDEALVKDCYRREQSVVPQQALALTNSAIVLDASEKIAQRLATSAADDTAFIRTAFVVVLGIDAGDAEMAASRESLEAWRNVPDGSLEKARAHFIWALLNHNDFVTLR
jgi:hypothetical protein